MVLKTSIFFEKLTKISKPIVWISFALGLVLSWSVLSGDSAGRVNLLYLIILYVIFPCSSLVYSLLSYFYSSLQLGSLTTLVISFVQNNNFIFKKYKREYLKLPQNESPKLVLLYFSQLAAMSFSVASLLVLFILLIATDVHFIWRSTLLNSEHLLDILHFIALPWQFWQEAQPNLEMISNSQDNRLISNVLNSSSAMSNNWWKFVLATQILYAFLMRFAVVILLQINFRFNQIKNSSTDINCNRASAVDLSMVLKNNDDILSKKQLSEMSMKDITLDYAVNNWANISLRLLNKIIENLSGKNINIINAGPGGTESERLIADRWRETQLIVVKSWEPPLAELSDYMQNSMGYILPLDIKNEIIVDAKDFHLQEWLRFSEKHTQWKILILPELAELPEPTNLQELSSLNDLTDEAVKNNPNIE